MKAFHVRFPFNLKLKETSNNKKIGLIFYGTQNYFRLRIHANSQVNISLGHES